MAESDAAGPTVWSESALDRLMRAGGAKAPAEPGADDSAQPSEPSISEPPGIQETSRTGERSAPTDPVAEPSGSEDRTIVRSVPADPSSQGGFPGERTVPIKRATAAAPAGGGAEPDVPPPASVTHPADPDATARSAHRSSTPDAAAGSQAAAAGSSQSRPETPDAVPGRWDLAGPTEDLSGLGTSRPDPEVADQEAPDRRPGLDETVVLRRPDAPPRGKSTAPEAPPRPGPSSWDRGRRSTPTADQHRTESAPGGSPTVPTIPGAAGQSLTDALGLQPPAAPRRPTRQERRAAEQTEPARAEQERAEQEKSEQQRAEQQRADQQRAEQQRAEQQRAEQQRAEQQRADQQRAEQERAEQRLGEHGPASRWSSEADQTMVFPRTQPPPEETPTDQTVVLRRPETTARPAQAPTPEPTRPSPRTGHVGHAGPGAPAGHAGPAGPARHAEHAEKAEDAWKAGKGAPDPVTEPESDRTVAFRVTGTPLAEPESNRTMPISAATTAPIQAPAEPQPAPRRPRGRRKGVLAAVVVLALALAGVLVVRPGPVERWLAGPEPTATVPTPAAEPTPPPVLVAAATDDLGPTPDGVRAAVDKLIAEPGIAGAIDVSIVEVGTGKALYSARQDELDPPASTTKLVTAATVLAARGPTYRIPTRAVLGAEPGVVVLVGGGDATLAADKNGSFPGVGRLDELAAQVKKALGGTAPTKVVYDTSLFTGPTGGPAWDDDILVRGNSARITSLMVNGGRRKPKFTDGADLRHDKPDEVAAQAFAKSLGVTKVEPGRAPELAQAGPSGSGPSGSGPSGSGPSGSGPSGSGSASSAPPVESLPAGSELGRVESPPMVRLVEWMLQYSDNTIAETLARQVALARAQPASFEGAASAMDAVVGELGLNADELDLSDGSGLSRENRVTPSLLTDLLALAADGKHWALAGMFAGLPVAGWSGTLGGRYELKKPAEGGRGMVRAKTGSLSGVNALSGVVQTKSGHLLAFALLAEGEGDRFKAQPALDRVASTLVACGCR